MPPIMTTLRLTVPETIDVAPLIQEIVAGLADRLRDDHGYELDESACEATGSVSRNVYALRPHGSIVIKCDGALTVSLHQIDVDARDLFTGLISELEQRHEGLRAEID